MTIIRIRKDAEHPYVQVNRKLIDDTSISLKLKGFLVYCLSKPNDWRFHVAQLATTLKEGKKAIYATIREGIKAGYIQRFQPGGDGQAWGPMEYIIAEEPSNNVSREPLLGTPELGTPERAIHTKHGDTLSIECTKEREAQAPPPPRPKRKNQHTIKCPLTAEDKTQLASEPLMQACDLNQVIAAIEDWVAANGKEGYACWKAAIRNWVRRESKFNRPSPGTQNTQQSTQPKIEDVKRQDDNKDFLMKCRKAYGSEIALPNGSIIRFYTDAAYLNYPNNRSASLHSSDPDFKLTIVNCLVAANKDLDALDVVFN